MASDDGFLSRWSRRKTQVREGRPQEEPHLEPAPVPAAQTAQPHSSAIDNKTQAATPPMPTLVDVQQLTPESDFTGFMARGVAPDVKNAAMKKLFADPHFNVMDRLDIYIDDYTQPDPLPLAMLRQMTSAKALSLFDEQPEPTANANLGDNPATQEPQVVAQSVPADTHSYTEPTPHDDADLRLQPDPTPRPEGAEPKPV